jgi:hypothetical protein
MRAAIVAGLVVSVLGGVILACGEDTGTTASPDGGTGMGTSSSSSGGSRDGDASADGGDRAPTGCLLSTTGYTAGTKAENVARTDVQNTVDWTNVENALTDDGKFATVTLAAGQQSATLRVSGFGFSIPASAETWGIEVQLKRQAPDGGVQDHQINVEIEGKPSRYKVLTVPWPTTIVGTHDYGQAVDTWGVDLYPADVDKATFAAAVTIERTSDATGPVTALVDSLKIAVHYCAVPVKK